MGAGSQQFKCQGIQRFRVGLVPQRHGATVGPTTFTQDGTQRFDQFLRVLRHDGTRGYVGERLHLLHLVGMLLIVAVGSNYALFFDRAAGQLEPDTLASMAVANLTTAIGFGTLGLSQVPVLHAIGVTVGPGAVLALLLAAMFVPRETSA